MALAIIYSINDQSQFEKLNERYFESFNESFEGRITNVVNEYNVHTCLISIELSNSTTEQYDIRETTDDYYAVIKGNRAVENKGYKSTTSRLPVRYSNVTHK